MGQQPIVLVVEVDPTLVVRVQDVPLVTLTKNEKRHFEKRNIDLSKLQAGKTKDAYEF